MSCHVFVYGTLLVPEMMQVVTAATHESRAAKAGGYVRRYLHGRIYPGIAADEASMVAGRVYLDVSGEALARLDYFEGPEYVRQTLQVELEDGTLTSAEAYVVPDEKRSLLADRAWRLEEFVELGLDQFLAHAREAMQHFEPGRQVRR